MTDEQQYCEHCTPAKVRTHVHNHITWYLNRLGRLLGAPFRWAGLSRTWVLGVKTALWRYIVLFSNYLGLAKFQPIRKEDRRNFFNRALIFYNEALRRGLDVQAVYVLGYPTNEFVLAHRGRRYVYEEIPATLFPADTSFDNKCIARHIFNKHAIPIPRGGCFIKKQKALAYSHTLTYPLVVKPANGSLSKHATYPIENERELERAIDIAKRYEPQFILEEFVDGVFFRASVIGEKHVFVCKKEPATVTGDGIHSVAQLIEIKNQSERRGGAARKDTTLHEVPVNHLTEALLEKQGYTLTSVPDAGVRVIVQPKLTLGSGCDIHVCTDEVHPKNKALIRRAAGAVENPLVGFDIICNDISVPHTEQTFAFIEANSLPYLDMHAHPSDGAPDPVAEVVWDYVLERLSQN